jgi:hypothetical protein
MTCLSPSAEIPLLISRNRHSEAITAALRLHVGRGSRYSVKQLWVATGVPERRIEAAMCEPDDPEWRQLGPEHIASIAKFLKVPFASAYLELSGLGAFELMDAQPPLPQVLTSAPVQESPEDERKRLIRRLAELEDLL